MRRGLGLLFSVLLGCSGTGDRPGAEARRDPPVVSGAALESDTIPAIPATGAAESDQPAVLFRCEDGRLGVYLVPGDSGNEGAEAQLVPVTLDSTPSC